MNTTYFDTFLSPDAAPSRIFANDARISRSYHLPLDSRRRVKVLTGAFQVSQQFLMEQAIRAPFMTLIAIALRTRIAAAYFYVTRARICTGFCNIPTTNADVACIRRRPRHLADEAFFPVIQRKVINVALIS